MHLDLTHMLPEHITADIGNTAPQYGAYCPHMLWPLWLQHVDISKTPVNVLQAAAQLLSSYNCVIATLRFGLYCSRHFPTQGNVVSDDVALHYLRLAFQMLTQSQQQEGLLIWLQQAEGFEYIKEERELFWVHACAAYAQHEYDVSPDYMNDEIEFAFNFLLNIKK